MSDIYIIDCATPFYNALYELFIFVLLFDNSLYIKFFPIKGCYVSSNAVLAQRFYKSTIDEILTGAHAFAQTKSAFKVNKITLKSVSIISKYKGKNA